MQRQRRNKQDDTPSPVGSSNGRPGLSRVASKTKRPRGQTALCLAILFPFVMGTLLLLSTRLLSGQGTTSTGTTAGTTTLSSGGSTTSHERKMSTATEGDDAEYHIVFSTGCSLYQDWQSYVFFYQAMVSKQPGTVTRIVSGCEDQGADAEAQMEAIFNEQIKPMSPEHFRIHFTPDYSKLAGNGKTFVYFNKPFGMRHWLENAQGHPGKPINENAIVILLDPDQLIMRPFTNNDFSNTDWKFLSKGEAPYTRIEHGKPMGQLYGFGLQWKSKVNMTAIAPNSPVDKLTNHEAQKGYIVGPPYVATSRDMYSIVQQWSDFALPVHFQYPFLLAEMFAYCLGAAHKELPHQTAASFMISDAGAGNAEGWRYIDTMPDKEVCGGFTPAEVPNVLHFCQRYGMGNYFFGKRKLPKDFLTCESPLLSVPPKDVLSKYKHAMFPSGKRKDWTPVMAKRNAFVICYMIPSLNAAATYYKKNHCDPKTANFEESLLLSVGPPGS